MKIPNNDWKKILKQYIDSERINQLIASVEKKYQEEIVYPEKNNVFKALELTTYKNTKVVIIGQDPYHGENQAHGLAFSTLNKKLPPSLKNIYKELESDIGVTKNIGDLTSWTKEGVLLLNSILTVQKDTPGSHKNLDWEEFTNSIIKSLSNKEKPIVFILWGNYAIAKEQYITSKKHLVIKSTHPSPFSANKGFFGSKPFSKTNKFLKENNQKEVNW